MVNWMKARLTRRLFLQKTAVSAGTGVLFGGQPLPRTAASLNIPDRKKAFLIGRVLDAETRQVIPCTVTIRTSANQIVVEHPSFAGGFRSSGRFEKAVPSGDTTIAVSRGFDYVGVERKLLLREGERAEVTFALERRADLRRQEWYCGDNHVHMIHGEREIMVRFPYVAESAQAAGLDYMSLAQQWNLSPATPERLDQACREASRTDFQLTWNMEAPKNYWRGNVSHCLGHGWTLAMRGYTAEREDAVTELARMSAGDYQSEKAPTPNFESHALIHSLGGVVSYTHPTRERWGKWGGRGEYPLEERKFISNLAQELPYDTVVGPTYDMIDIMMTPEEREVNEKAQRLWFMLLNRGYRIAATASSDSCFDRRGGGVPGEVRVYTRLNGPLTLAEIAKAMKAGRNFVTSGPLVLLKIGEYQPGDVVPVKQPVNVKACVKVWASGEAGEFLTKVELIRNGEVVKKFGLDGPRTEFTSTFDVNEAESAWYITRCWGSGERQIAITNPIYFESEDYQPPEPTPANVTASVTSQATSEPLAGTCEVIKMIGQTPVRESSHHFEGGKFSLVVPGTARIRVEAPGYLPQVRSIFMDYAPLLDLILNLRGDALIDWSTFEKVKTLLAEVRLEFALTREKTK